ncbi:MAG: acyl-CoA dehydrogenase family protein [Syntrophaceae bacterium]|nr:acyl-CoA dehydrogenase family protein [Syntrophaceae bacterium]
MMGEIEKEREMIRAAAAKAAQKVVQPLAAAIDATGEFPWELVDAFGKQGLLSILLPEEYGGTDGNITSFSSVIEEIAKVSGSSSLLILAHGVGTLPIWWRGNPSQKETYFTQISEKNHLTTLALTEAGAGPDLASLTTTAKKEGKDYVLNGRKSFITHGSIAHLYSVFAVTDPALGAKGISAFVVEDGTPGLRFGKREEKIGMRGSVTTDVIFENCRIPQENRLGEEGEGWMIAGHTLHRARPAVGALAVGIAQGALDYALRYANERIQFKKPISSFQAIQFMIADMATQIEAARSLVYDTAAQIDAGVEGLEKLSAITKCFASEVAMRVTTDAVQILGGYGYMKDYPVERMMRDAKVTQIYGKPNQAERLFIVQQLLKG